MKLEDTDFPLIEEKDMRAGMVVHSPSGGVTCLIVETTAYGGSRGPDALGFSCIDNGKVWHYVDGTGHINDWLDVTQLFEYNLNDVIRRLRRLEDVDYED